MLNPWTDDDGLSHFRARFFIQDSMVTQVVVFSRVSQCV
jgi:hypothetical protein